MNAQRRKALAELRDRAQAIASEIDAMLGEESSDDAVSFLEVAVDSIETAVEAMGDASEVKA